MKKIVFYLLALVLTVSCNELTEFYTSEYKYSYTRPIGLMMSKAFDTLNLSGKGIKIGVIDAGFGKFKTNEFTKNLNIVAYRDFVDEDTTNFFSSRENDHGTIVTKSIGGKNSQNQVYGLAFGSKYYLAKTDIYDKEPIEDEKRLIKAIDWLISQDVKLINISLGYTTFDDDDSYSNKDLNGKTALSSKHIDSILNANKDIIIVVSAGNEGNKKWKHITFPSDVKDVITVGSTDFDGIKRFKSSGTGVDYVNYIKPEIATYPIPIGNSNTTPVITGLIACILEKQNLNRDLIKEIVIESSSNYNSPNKEIGYGVPKTSLILAKIKKYR
ncbi:S8 family serine peptidase [Paucihalobacter ruber]|nr:S8 family serine peptidase [Paucihalobacter ruber]